MKTYHYCGMCGETFQNNQQLEVHTRTHEETNFLCPSCIHFRTNIDLADHVETEHKTNLNISFPDNNDTPEKYKQMPLV